ncbi:ABC transporter ATP-binding protein [Vreelandella sulfidaeris]|uniref:ABC transporter ATP-binding protein n=1 Tax=Vreelandella sulfidaeris TaxID=115553 RepID=UPI0035E5404E
MYSDIAIEIASISKRFEIFKQPRDRLKQMLLPRLQRSLGLPPKQYFREFWAVKNISFSVKKGETVGIIGRNGSGKSTLLQMLCGTLSPTTGNIKTVGRVAALLELGAGFNPEFTGKENIYMNASVLGLSKAEIDDRYDKIVSFSGIGEFIDQPTKTYSSGMMVRLAFSVVAHVDADILIIDEALAVGDAFFTQKCMNFLRQFMQRGTVLFVSHDTSAVRSLCDRAVWLDYGNLVMDGTPKDVSERYLEAFYESQQGKVDIVKSETKNELSNKLEYKDQRDLYINKSNLRNDLEVFKFNPTASSFGSGNARITNVQFLNEAKSPFAWIVGGEDVLLTVEVENKEELFGPIVGFFVKNKLGQEVFGDNTFLSYQDKNIVCPPNSKITANFYFQMPRLAVGDYSLTIAIAEGTQHEHIQHHWIHDALMFRSEASSVVSGEVGIPMKEIMMKVHND